MKVISMMFLNSLFWWIVILHFIVFIIRKASKDICILSHISNKWIEKKKYDLSYNIIIGVRRHHRRVRCPSRHTLDEYIDLSINHLLKFFSIRMQYGMIAQTRRSRKSNQLSTSVLIIRARESHDKLLDDELFQS